MALSGTREGIFEQVEHWHRIAMYRLNSVEFWYAHFRQRDKNEWLTVRDSVRSLRDQLKDEGELPAWIRSWFSSAAEENITTYAGVSGASAHEVAFTLTERMLSVGVTKSFVGMLEPLDSAVPLIVLVVTEFDRVGAQLNHVSAPDEIISIFAEGAAREQPFKRPRGSRRNSKQVRLKNLLRHQVFPGSSPTGRN
jgi:hypothetical protein